MKSARPKLLTQARFLARRFEPLDMSKVLDIVFLLGRENDMVFFKGNEYSVCDLCCEIYSRHHAKTVQVWFEGGPPPTPPSVASEWYEGSLYTFVLDRIMHDIATNGGVGNTIRRLKVTAKKKEEATA